MYISTYLYTGSVPGMQVTSNHLPQYERQFSSSGEQQSTPNHQPAAGLIPSPGTGTGPHQQPTPVASTSSNPRKPHPPLPLSPTTTNSAPPPLPSPPPRLLTPKYHSREVSYGKIADIPEELLSAVALCYNYNKTVCRNCFFRKGCRQITSTKKSSSTCLEGHSWRALVIMPGCRLCSNANYSMHIPILPIPRHMKESRAPFNICKRTDHLNCHLMTKNTNPWFPHTVEELVVWTVERERGELEREGREEGGRGEGEGGGVS